MEKTVPSAFKFRKPAFGLFPRKSRLIYDEAVFIKNLKVDLKARILALAIFFYLFIESGTLGLIPEKYYLVYRSIRISDLILYGTIAYSFIKFREYKDLFKSKSLTISKIILLYLLFEFTISAIKYQFNAIEYFFRLKGIWSSFLVFPFLLLYKRNGMMFLVKIIFPVAVISNILYILSAVTGIPFMPETSVITQTLPGDIVVFRVFGGTFYGEFFFLGFIYFWITRRFKLWHIFPVMLFIIPHILAFGRMAWATFAFTILVMVFVNSLKKRNFKLLLRQTIIMTIMCLSVLVCFIEVIPESEHYFEALQSRVFQGGDDVKYNEGTYGARVLFQNDALVRLWYNSDRILGVGMSPMWVYRPESFEEQVYYNAFCDVVWTGVLAAYGIVGFILAAIFQLYYIITSFKIIKRVKENNIQLFLLVVIFAKFFFDTFINFSFALFTMNLWGFAGITAFYVSIIACNYENEKMGSRK